MIEDKLLQEEIALLDQLCHKFHTINVILDSKTLNKALSNSKVSFKVNKKHKIKKF